jgi:hypothetical protein
MDLRFTKAFRNNIIAIVGTIIAFFAAIAAIGGSMLTGIMVSACPINGWLWFCVAWHYMLFLFVIVAGVLGTVFGFAVLGDFIIFLNKWIPKKIQEYRDRPLDIFCKIIKKDNEVYLEVENREWFDDAFPIYASCGFTKNGETILDRIKWVNIFSDNGEATLFHRQKRLLHLATIDKDKKGYCIHSINRDIFIPFHETGRVFELFIGGSTFSANPSRQHIKINVVILESINNDEINFEVKRQW